MKYLSLDIETTGIDRSADQILQLAAVVENTEECLPLDELPSFSCYIQHDRISGSPFALSMNADILKMLATGKGRYPIVEAHRVSNAFLVFLQEHFGVEGKITAAGKNVAGFDIPFLQRAYPTVASRFSHRSIDPGSFCLDWEEGPENLAALKKRFGVPGGVTHDALEDARDVVAVLRAARGVPK